MANPEHLQRLTTSVEDWNNWRHDNPTTTTTPDLGGAYLGGANLRGADLVGANLIYSNLSRADLNGADLTGADLTGADLTGADLRGVEWGTFDAVVGCLKRERSTNAKRNQIVARVSCSSGPSSARVFSADPRGCR